MKSTSQVTPLRRFAHPIHPLLIAVLLLFSCSQGPKTVVYTDVTAKAGIAFVHNNGSSGRNYFPETVGSGCGWFDADGDGHLDLYYVNASDLPGRNSPQPSRDALYHNNGDGTFTDITEQAGLGDTLYGVGCVAADYDNDGDTDLFVANMGPNRLYRNRGDGTFEEVGAAAGVDDDRYNSSASFLDYDQNGHLDLYVASYIQWSASTDVRCTRMAGGVEHPIYCAPQNYKGLKDILYRNNGDGTFTDVSARAGIDGPAWNGLGVVTGDFNQDGWTDIYVGDDASPNLLWINQKDGAFIDEALISGTGYSIDGLFENGMGVAAGDYDRDGIPDLSVNNFDMQPLTIYRGIGGGMFEVASFKSNVAGYSIPKLKWGLHFFDYDNDGWEDIFSANGHIYENIRLFQPDTDWEQQDQIFRNNGDGTFADVSLSCGEYFSSAYASRGSAEGDYDNDGDLDLAICMNNRPAVLLRNDGGNHNNWIKVAVQGTKANRDGIGAKVTIRYGQETHAAERRAGGSFASCHDPRLHFGLGKARSVDLITVDWPGGGRDALKNIKAGQIVKIVQGEHPVD